MSRRAKSVKHFERSNGPDIALYIKTTFFKSKLINRKKQHCITSSYYKGQFKCYVTQMGVSDFPEKSVTKV